LLLNTAVPQIQAAQSGDTYVVPRDIAFSAALTLSAGTANGVPYLNASKVLTTGSALTYNGTGLGVGISSAGYLVDISTPLTGTTVGSNVALNLESQASGRDVEIRMGDTVNSSGRFGYLSGSLYWAFGSTEQMRLTSTGLGIGTSSPEKKLHVIGPQNGTDQDGATSFFGATATGEMRMYFGNNDAGNYSYIGAYEVGIAYRNLILQPNGGNLGLGVVPSAWNSNTKAIQVSTAASFYGLTNNQARMGANHYYDTAGTFRYLTTAAASDYQQWNGVHAWYTAPSGTAGNAITFSQVMTLDASGNLLLGTTLNGGNAKLKSKVSAGVTGLEITDEATSDFIVVPAISANVCRVGPSAGAMAFYSSNTERARIASGGNFQTSSGGSVQVGGTAARATTAGTNRVDIFDGTAPVGTLANGISFYSAAGEAYVMDAAGNATLISPHDSETNEWIFRSKHTPTGKVLRIDVERLLKFVNDHFGLDAVHEFIEE
jgi:hypothetical protein